MIGENAIDPVVEWKGMRNPRRAYLKCIQYVINKSLDKSADLGELKAKVREIIGESRSQ